VHVALDRALGRLAPGELAELVAHLDPQELDGLLGGNNGDSTSSNESASHDNQTFATNPVLDFNASDILHSQDTNQDGGNGGDSSSSDFVGIGDIGLGASSPIYASNDSQSYDSSHSQQDSNGDSGLLSGLL